MALFLTSRPARLGCEACSELFCPAVRGRWRTLSGEDKLNWDEPRPSYTSSLFRYTNRDLPVVNLRGEVLFQAWRDIFHDNRFVQLSAIQNTKSFKHLESLSFPKRESSTASVGRMFSTVLTGECLVNNDNYTKGWKVSFNSSEHKGPSVKSSDLKRWM